jgi:N-acetylglucosaminyldiphosphoundecaprenol N-acetyl-beta-D-mannosaminyltransferase
MTARVEVLGLGISAVNLPLAVAAIDDWVARREPVYVCVAAVHSVMGCLRDPPLLRVFNASGMTTPDGMPLVWLSRLAGHRHVERVYGPDLMLAVCQHSIAKGWRHFFCGGAPGVAEDLAVRLTERFPGLAVAGVFTPPYEDMPSSEEEGLARRINKARADVVWVGLGTGRQEYWMSRFRGRLVAPVLLGVGAAFDFLSGRKPQAPRWIQRSGLEWLFRLASEPRRLWPRYRQYPLFVVLVLAQLLGLRKYPMPQD